MATCNGCGGIVGRDCFNPQECEQISRSMDIEYAVRSEQQRLQNQYYKQQEAEYYVWLEKYLNNYPGAYWQPLFTHMADKHGVILTLDEMQEIVNVVTSMQTGGEACKDGTN